MNYQKTIKKKITEKDLNFIGYILNKVDEYISKKPLDRIALIEAIALLSKIVFCEQTPLNVKEQCEEIDIFYNHLKHYAKKIKK